MMDGMKGWVLSELESVRTAQKQNDDLPRMKKGSGLYTMPMNYPWDLPARKCEAHGSGAAQTIEPVPVDTAPLFTGSIGTITHFTMHCDVFQPNPKYQTKYIYSLVHRRGKVMVYVWHRNPDSESKTNTTYWYEYRSAREARVDMKKHGIGRRGW